MQSERQKVVIGQQRFWESFFGELSFGVDERQDVQVVMRKAAVLTEKRAKR